MYTQFFSLKQAPFSIAPDPRYLLMTDGHREALAHLLYGVNSGGGVVLLTGEVGAGKTTVCRCFLEQVPANCNVAYIFNPKLTVNELLQSICDEFRIDCKDGNTQAATVKDYVDALTRHLLASHAEGRNNVLVIDEAQNLSADVLEQLRLLTNLETNERKLLQITLIGQPELRTMLERPELKQLAQRIIARYHLQPLSQQETASYIEHRLAVAGLATAQPFRKQLVKQIHRLAHGVPRRINLLCDRALLGAYAEEKREVDRAIIDRAATEVFGHGPDAGPAKSRGRRHMLAGAAAGAVLASAGAWILYGATLNNAILTGSLPAAMLNPAPPAPAEGISVKTAAQDTPAVEKAGARSEVAPPATPNLPEAVVHSRIGLDNQADAYQQLARMWGVALPNHDPCAAATEHGLQCYISHGGFAELRQLDRPALLTLRDSGRRTTYALLTALTDTSATLQAGAASQTLSPLVLARYFTGDFATMWRAPRPYRGYLGSGDQGAGVDWVAEQLAKLNGEQSPGTNRLFDEKMAQRVREFQLAQGLGADGKVGPLTFMHLNRIAGFDEPRLKTSPAAAPAAQ